MTRTDQWPAILRDPKFKEQIKTKKLLCVGAGGIGCELLKTLVCTGFEHISVIDLDTIETSNLNRQFLFRKHHVGESKARTAASVIRGIKPQAEITAHHANVKEPQFGIEYIKGFDLILNGLDNLEARRHVNRLAMAAGVPLVESGTAGYLGQVTVHLKGVTECFECHPKPVPKSFPICTLRNTPDKPIHCIVWAKDMLFSRLFGKPDQVTDLDEQSAKQDAVAAGANEAEAAAQAAATVAAAAADDPSAFVRREDESPVDYAVRMFNRLYREDMERLIGMTDLWQTRAPPTALDLPQLLGGGSVESALAPGTGTGTSHTSATRALGLTDPKQVLSAADNARVFLQSIVQYHTDRKEEVGQATFDKDDDLAVEFVTAASNLRSFCYGIPPQSLFDAKGMAGNIIHAIATTNAIVSGLIVVEALKLLAGCRDKCRATYINEAAPNTRRLIMPSASDTPVPGCSACNRVVLTLYCDTHSMTLGQLVDKVVKSEMRVRSPSLMSGQFVYEEDEDLDEDEVEENARHLPKALSKLPDGGLVSGKLLHVSDNSRSFSVDVVVLHKDGPDWKLEGTVPESTAPPPSTAQPAAEPAANGANKPTPSKASKTAAETDDGAILIDDSDSDDVVVEERLAVGGGLKRGREEADGNGDAGHDNGHQAKKAKADAADDDDVIIID